MPPKPEFREHLQRWARGVLLWVSAGAIGLGVGQLLGLACAPESPNSDANPPAFVPPDPYANLTRPSMPDSRAEQLRASVSGRIHDADDNAIVGAQVCAGRFVSDDPRMQTGAEGDYQIDGLRAGIIWLRASAPTFEPISKRIELMPGQVAEHVDIELRPGGVGLSGVVDDIYGNQLAGARISTGNAVTFSDEQGHFRLWVKSDDQVHAVADGYAETTMHGKPSDGPAELVLLPESVIVGTVVDARTEEPLEGVRVFAHGQSSVSHGSARTDEAGRFRVVGLTPGDYELSVTDLGVHGHGNALIHLGLAETSDEISIRAHPAAYVVATV